MADHSATLFFSIALPLLLVGIVLLRFGFWPKRRGNQPHCRRCNYLLIGIASDRCPECGGELPARAIIHGQRDRRTAVGSLGILLCLGAFYALWQASSRVVRSIDWYHLKPSSWVMDDLRSPQADQQRAIAELQRRHFAYELPPRYVDEIDAMGLTEQARVTNIPLATPLIRFAQYDYLAGGMSADQRLQFEQQAVRVTLQVRPMIKLGEQIPYMMNTASRMVDDLWASVEVVGVAGDGKVLKTTGFYAPMIIGDLNSVYSATGTGSSLKWSEPDRHALGMTVRVRLYRGALRDDSHSKLLRDKTRTVTSPFEVVAQLPATSFTVQNAPALATKIQASMKLGRFYVRDLDHALCGQLRVQYPPADLAFRTFVRINGQEFEAASFTCPKTGISDVGLWVPNYKLDTRALPPTCDLILRSDETVARQTLDAHSMWSGEIDFQNVPITAK